MDLKKHRRTSEGLRRAIVLCGPATECAEVIEPGASFAVAHGLNHADEEGAARPDAHERQVLVRLLRPCAPKYQR